MVLGMVTEMAVGAKVAQRPKLHSIEGKGTPNTKPTIKEKVSNVRPAEKHLSTGKLSGIKFIRRDSG